MFCSSNETLQLNLILIVKLGLLAQEISLHERSPKYNNLGL